MRDASSLTTKQKKELLEKLPKLSPLLESKDSVNLVANIVHEINTPLNYVLGNLSVLTEYLDAYQEIMMLYEELSKEIIRDKRYENLNAIREICVDKQEKLDFKYIQNDIKPLINSTFQGVEEISFFINRLRDMMRE